METQKIIQKLKATPYKFSTASKIKDELKTLPVDLRTIILDELRLERNKFENTAIQNVLSELIADLKSRLD